MDSFFNDLEKGINNKHLLKHDFYKAWSEGRLSKACLQEYALEYYHHVNAFPLYLSSLHSHTQDSATRKALLQNLIEEEAGLPNHPELWKEFALNLGVSEREMAVHRPCQAIIKLIDLFKKICLEGSVAEGLAALFSYESQIPSICVSKIEGLRKYYDMEEAQKYRYFSVHIHADEEHSLVERDLLKKHVNEENAPKALKASQSILEALWNFLSYLTERYHVQCA